MSDLNNSEEQLLNTRESISAAQINTINVLNTKEGYQEYFKMGGTVAKMSHMSTKNYANFVKNRNSEE